LPSGSTTATRLMLVVSISFTASQVGAEGGSVGVSVRMASFTRVMSRSLTPPWSKADQSGLRSMMVLNTSSLDSIPARLPSAATTGRRLTSFISMTSTALDSRSSSLITTTGRLMRSATRLPSSNRSMASRWEASK